MHFNKNYYEDYDKHAPRIYMFIKGMTGEQEVAINILTQVFLNYGKLIDNFGTYKGKIRDANVLSHLFISSKNECFNYFTRKNTSGPTISEVNQKVFQARIVKEVSEFYDIKHKNIFQRVKDIILKPIVKEKRTFKSYY